MFFCEWLGDFCVTRTQFHVANLSTGNDLQMTRGKYEVQVSLAIVMLAAQ